MPKISAYPAGAPLQASDKFIITRGGNNYYILGSEFLPQTGGMRNGKISVTVVGNNLTLALKTLSGADPSASNPVLIYIGGAWRAISAALSVTKNAGTNWLNMGSAELATHAVNLFARIGYNAIDGVTIGFNRDPNARIYSEFNTTTTNEKYCAISTITNAAANDEYVIIGRFTATLSAGAAFTWSVPTFTASNLIQRLIEEGEWSSWTPTVTYLGGTTNPTSNTVNFANYHMHGRRVDFEIRSTLVRGGGDRTFTIYSLPFSRKDTNYIVFASDSTFNSTRVFGSAYSDAVGVVIVSVTMNQNGVTVVTGSYGI